VGGFRTLIARFIGIEGGSAGESKGCLPSSRSRMIMAQRRRAEALPRAEPISVVANESDSPAASARSRGKLAEWPLNRIIERSSAPLNARADRQRSFAVPSPGRGRCVRS
jgi:hypothetical protein